MSEPGIAIDGLVRHYGAVRAVDGATLSLGPGEFHVVLGPSGCGKSTLLRLIAGLEAPDGGTVRLGRRLVSGPGTHVPPEDRDVGVVFQSYALWPHMDVRANAAFPVQGRGLPRGEREAIVDRALAAVSLSELAERRPADLSGGQRQRVALARCLAQGAKTVLMDEPLANLDPHLRARMEDELAAFHARTGATTFYITHDQREAMALATRMSVMWGGRILQTGAPEAVYARPADERVARFVGRSALVPRGALDPAIVEGTGALAVVRPEDVAAGEGTPVRVTGATYRGGRYETRVADAAGNTFLLDLPARPASGDELRVRVRRAWSVDPGVVDPSVSPATE